MSSTGRLATLLAALTIVGIAGIDAALARGGAPNVMDSPGYQRALQESRKRLQAQPDVAPPAAIAGPRRHHRHHRRHR